MTAARQALWRKAQALSDLAGPALPPRLRRLAVAGDAPLSLEDVRALPDWARPDADAQGLARLTGAVLVSRAWRRAIAGDVLGRACEAVGEAALDALLALPDLMTPEVEDAAAAAGDAAALDRLGLSALLSATAEEEGLRNRLAHRLGGAAGAPVSEAKAASAMRTAQGVMISLAEPATAGECGVSFLALRTGDDGVATDAWRIPAPEVDHLRSALDLRAAAQARLAEADAQVANAVVDGRAEGYAAGREEGRRAAAAETADAFAALVAQVRGDHERLRRELGRLSLEVVRRVADELGPQAVLEAVAHRAAREVLAEAPLVVRVAPDAAPGVAQRLWPLNAEVEVVGDAAVAPGDCVISSRQGAAHAGLALQLAALERAFSEAAG